jgi:ribonuclease D
LTQSNPSHVWVEDTPALEAAIARLENAPYVGVDTEADSRHHYPEKTCLIQIGSGDEVYIVDPLSSVDVSLLEPLLSDQSVQKLFHGADFDLRGMNRDWGFEIHNVYDTNVSARFAGLERFGLAALIEDLLGKVLPKDQRLQRSDWSQRPLSAEALEYAAGDVVYLADVRDAINLRLEERGRTAWVAEELLRLEQIRFVPPDPETAFLSVKGAAKLPDRALGVLKSLYEMRDAEARRINRPTAFIVPSEAMIAMAAEPDVDLTEVTGLSPNLLRRLAPNIRKAIKTGLELGPIKRPPPQYPFRPRMSAEQESRLKTLKEWRNKHGKELQLDPSLLWPMRSFERLARDPSSFDDEITVGDVRDWQRDEFGTAVKALLL